MARDLLLEIGSEELPASFILPALEDLQRILTERMAQARLKHGELRTFGTPRRLAVWVKDVADSGEDVTSEKLGPSLKAAFDKEIENAAFVGRPQITVTRLTEEADVVVAEGDVRAARRDGGRLHAVFCDVFVMREARIKHLTSYLMELPE